MVKMALTRADIADRLIIKQGLPKTTAQEFVDSFFEQIASTLESGEIVKLTGFGNFELKVKNARPGRNPKTGKEVTISSRRVTTFRAGQKLRNRIDMPGE
jgi:integration host factor subunit alpha